MAVKIQFDSSHNALSPTFILSTKGGKLLGSLPAKNVRFRDCLNKYSDLKFDVYKKDCELFSDRWEQLSDFKLVWAKEWNIWFELYVELNESNKTIKNVSAKSLGEAELSQIKLYNIEINTEIDIEREDYQPTILFDELRPEISLLHRIMEKAPHYKVCYVDNSISNIQRTFSFDNKTIYDAFQEIAQEIDCLFEIKCSSDDNGKILREIYVYDLESCCEECGTRGNFTSKCESCEGENIRNGFGEDTTIYVSTENLAKDIRYSTDNGSVKNCFKLEAGDDLMTATIVNCNPNGSGYLWYISDSVKEDMSNELVERIESYNDLYEYYQKEDVISINETIVENYNALINKYREYTNDYNEIPKSITGYPQLMQSYYDTIDFYYYLNNSMMPSIETSDTNAQTEGAKLTESSLSPVGVMNSNYSLTTASNYVLLVAKTLINKNYRIKVDNSSLSNNTWTGSFIITNYSNDDDTYTTPFINVEITTDIEKYVSQKLEKSLNDSNAYNEAYDIVELFKKNDDSFKNEIKKYSLVRLSSFHDACQSCLDILIQQGVADKGHNLYNTFYLSYYNKLGYLADEIIIRENELKIVLGEHDKDGELLTEGAQVAIEKARNQIQNSLDFEKYLGEELWLEFAAYRREDTYKNDNYISDGLNNMELFKNALEFINVARKEIYKSATLQHSISATLDNLLVMKEFMPIVEYFEVGNWLRIEIDGKIYKLRLLEYEISFDDLAKIDIVFSDVMNTINGSTDIESILNQASSMATSYGSVARQASQGQKFKSQIDDWATIGLAVTKTKIIDSADNQNVSWDSHGLSFKEYLPTEDSYDEKQVKIINRGLYVTDNGWKTSRAGIGDFEYYNPKTKSYERTYGVIADTLVGNLIISEELGVYNTSGSLSFDTEGLRITNNINTLTVNPNASKLFVLSNSKRNILSVDENGDLEITGKLNAATGSFEGKISCAESEFKPDTPSIGSFYSKIENGQFKMGKYTSSSNYTIYGQFDIGTESSLTSGTTPHIGIVSTKASSGFVICSDGTVPRLVIRNPNFKSNNWGYSDYNILLLDKTHIEYGLDVAGDVSAYNVTTGKVMLTTLGNVSSSDKGNTTPGILIKNADNAQYFMHIVNMSGDNKTLRIKNVITGDQWDVALTLQS